MRFLKGGPSEESTAPRDDFKEGFDCDDLEGRRGRECLDTGAMVPTMLGKLRMLIDAGDGS